MDRIIDLIARVIKHGSTKATEVWAPLVLAAGITKLKVIP